MTITPLRRMMDTNPQHSEGVLDGMLRTRFIETLEEAVAAGWPAAAVLAYMPIALAEGLPDTQKKPYAMPRIGEG